MTAGVLTTGVYVIQFSDHVKIGQSSELEYRLRVHEKAGALRVHTLPVPWPTQVCVESLALTLAAKAGRRRGKREQFDGLSFDHAVDIVRQAAERARREMHVWSGMQCYCRGAQRANGSSS
jgi:hypothetical protein